MNIIGIDNPSEGLVQTGNSNFGVLTVTNGETLYTCTRIRAY